MNNTFFLSALWVSVNHLAVAIDQMSNTQVVLGTKILTPSVLSALSSLLSTLKLFSSVLSLVSTAVKWFPPCGHSSGSVCHLCRPGLEPAPAPARTPAPTDGAPEHQHLLYLFRTKASLRRESKSSAWLSLSSATPAAQAPTAECLWISLHQLNQVLPWAFHQYFLFICSFVPYLSSWTERPELWRAQEMGWGFFWGISASLCPMTASPSAGLGHSFRPTVFLWLSSDTPNQKRAYKQIY